MRNDRGRTHEAADAAICSKCRQMQLPFFDFGCSGCTQMLENPSTTTAHIFGIMRQWVPQVQLYIPQLIHQILNRGAGVHDRDGLTDMNLLHFACKSGSEGVGDANVSAKSVKMLLGLGADPNQRCGLTHMNALHYAVYFDVAPVVRLLLESTSNLDVNSICPKYDDCTALHMAANNLCLEVTKILLEFGADTRAKNAKGLAPNQCVPKVPDMPHAKTVIATIENLLTDSCKKKLSSSTGDGPSGRALLKSMGLSVGDKILIAGEKSGILRFCGATVFAMGLWAGVELESAEGKNNGTIDGVTYFTCRQGYGIFVPINKIKPDKSPTFRRRPSVRGFPSQTVTYPRIDFSGITSKIQTGLHLPSPKRKVIKQFPKMAERIQVAKKGPGTVRYVGSTRFAAGIWFGVELDNPAGKNDGTVNGVTYFECKPNYGIFVTQENINRLSDGSGEDRAPILPFQRKNHLLEPGGNWKYTMSLERNSSCRSSLRGKPRPKSQIAKDNKSAPPSPTATRKNSSNQGK